tara:strand:- start:382 stop:2451 length:2070 start_codon:yes stop_codon:yes gene_type:complete
MVSLALDIEKTVPGARVMAYGGRVGRKIMDVNVGDEVTVIVPAHGSKVLRMSGILPEPHGFRVNDVQTDACLIESLRASWFSSPTWTANPAIVEALESAGREAVTKITEKGWLAPGLAFHDYQYRSIGWSLTRPSALCVIPAGGGKTRTCLASALARLYYLRLKGPILVWGPAITQDAWERQVPLMCGKWMDLGKTTRLGAEKHHILRTWVLKPTSYRRKRDPSYEEYREWCRSNDVPPIVFIGDEGAPDLMEDIEALKAYPHLAILDEPHCMADNKRWNALINADGTTSFKAARSDSGSKVKRASVRNEVLKQTSLKGWIGADATPLSTGKSRRLWAPLDLLDPYGWGSWSAFKHKYTGPSADAFRPDLDDSEWRNMDELMARAKWIILEVSPAEVEKFMPPMRYEAVWLPLSAQDKVQVKLFSNDEGVEAGGNNPLERRLAHACHTKRTPIATTVVDDLASDRTAKTIIFVGRRFQVPIFATALSEAIEKRWTKGDFRPSHAQPNVKWAHGETSYEDRVALVEWFQSQESAVLVTTYQAMGTSIDGLQCANHVEVAMLPTQPGVWEQLVGRAKRLGGRGALIRAWFSEKSYDERAYSVFRARTLDVAAALPVTGGGTGAVAESLRNEAAWQAVLSDLAGGIDFGAWGEDDDEVKLEPKLEVKVEAEVDLLKGYARFSSDNNDPETKD